jgi:hypothetical protein
MRRRLAAGTPSDQALVERERFGITDREPAEARMTRIEEEVVLSGHDRRGHLEHDALARLGPTGANLAQLRRTWLAAPLRREVFDPYLANREAVRDLDREAEEVRREPVAMQVDELLQGGERPALRAVDHGSSGVVPAAAVQDRAFAGEGRRNVCCLADAPDAHQPTMPCSIRPRT